ncbi:glycosyltransferase [Cognatiyoonia sp. IB215446]|uniref:glycosyltransferase n=1 Tax=Cognatiyoonia sp. IB215446 TaxID=3097355 RepID=UPI002A1447D6|nr:glycosyltransferase [Cognatiyoonia sp. IB215446]MDX8347927.1 glycosyltransferase [Cognatiyoonia sp. IB215446]
MKILHVTPSYYPATYWGGPIWSTKAICDGIAARAGFDLRVLTTDAAAPSVASRVEPASLPYPTIYARRIAGHSVAPGLLSQLPRAIAWADIVHLTAVYSFPTLPTLLLAAMMGRPVVWSPRGALQATAEWEAAPNRKAKHLFERAVHLLRPVGTILHVTSDTEATQSRSRLGDIQTALIPNCVDIPRSVHRRSPDGQLRLICLGRLHRKKGIDHLIAAMEKLPANVHLDIYGTGDEAYERALIRKTIAMPHVQLHGHVDGARKAQAFANADLFVLPSHSENFGIAVAEALAHGVPAITTTDTPWTGLDQQGCGRCITLSQHDLADVIMDVAEGDLHAMGMRGRAWMQRAYSPAAMVDQFAALYRSLARGHAAEVLA